MHEDLAKLMEWAIWANLDSRVDLELVLLKGHLYMELLINTVLAESGLENYSDLSFFRKIGCLHLIPNANPDKVERIKKHLFGINEMRNKLAHEIQFDIHNGDLQRWSDKVLSEFEGFKFTRFTYRTKTVHAFSALTKAVMEIGLSR